MLLVINCRGTKEWKKSDHLKGYYNNPGESYRWLEVAVEMVRSSYITDIF